MAVKVMRPELAMTLGPDRFLREIQIAARLSHPHILPVHDAGESGGFLYYVMPYVEGESLRQRLNREGRLPVTNQVVERVSVSPDGQWLVYDSDRSGNAEVYRLPLDQPGAEPERLTTDSANDYAPARSPDGREIVFHSLRNGNRNLWIMNADGTNQRALTHGNHDEYSGFWSPDGQSLSFYADSAAPCGWA